MPLEQRDTSRDGFAGGIYSDGGWRENGAAVMREKERRSAQAR